MDKKTWEPEFFVMKFADSKIPVFKETRDKDYIKYGSDNLYPNYLTHLFNKSAKHNAIVTGKAKYIFGEGYENGDVVVNRNGDTLNDIAKKSILDIELYGGFRWEVIWNRSGKIGEMFHVDYATIRKGKDGGFYFKEDWTEKFREEPEYIPAFNPAYKLGSQIYSYTEYRPMVRYYPLPEYIGSNNYIETDIEISKYYLSSIRNGMVPSKMIQFFKGEPTEDKKKEIEARMSKKFAGAENAGRFLLVFNDANAAKSVEVNDLSGTELDKQFIEMNKTVSQEIFSGHNVTSPMLFGIKTEGQLGGSTELRVAYEIFQNTYSKPKANAFDRELCQVLKFSNWVGEFKLVPTEPVGLQFDVKDVLDKLPVEFIFDKLGIPKQYYPAPAPAPIPGQPGATAAEDLANEHIRNLSTKQHQQLMRIIRQYSKGQLTEAAARTLLKTGLGLDDEAIDNILGIEKAPVLMSADISEEDAIAIFDSFGECKDDYEVLKKKFLFGVIDDLEADEEVYIQEAFKTYDVTITEDAILELIKKDPKITEEVLASSLNQSVGYIKARIESLIKRGYLEESLVKIGIDTVVERIIPDAANILTPPTKKVDPARISIMYSYEPKPGLEPIIPTSRAFCRKLIGMNRLYNRADIEKMSMRLGYSVFDRKGGWWGNNPECRHRWVSQIVVRKSKTA